MSGMQVRARKVFSAWLSQRILHVSFFLRQSKNPFLWKLVHMGQLPLPNSTIIIS